MQHAPPAAAIVVDDITLTYEEVGAGRPVVYIHGALMTLKEGIIGLGPTLSPHFRMIAFDRPGHGGSGHDATTGSAWRQARLIHDALTALDVANPILVGHSFGGAVAMAYALQFPGDLAGVVALAPIAFPEPRLEQILLGLRAVPGAGDMLSLFSRPSDELILPLLLNGMFLPQAMTDAFRADFPVDAAMRRSQLRADGEDAAMMIASLTRNAMLYRSCRTPVRVLQGDSDLVVNPYLHGRLLASVLPNGHFTNLPGLGHMAHHFLPDLVLDAIRAVSEESDSLLAARAQAVTETAS